MAKDNTSRKWVRQWRRGETADLAVDAALDKIAEAIKCEASEDEEIALSPADKAWNALSPADRAHAVWLKAKVRGWDAPDENAAKVLWYKIEGAAFERDVIDFKLSAVERKRLKQIETIISKAERLLAVANDKRPPLRDEFIQCWPSGATSPPEPRWFADFNITLDRIRKRQDHAAKVQGKAGSTSSRVFINGMRAIYRGETGKEPAISRPKKILDKCGAPEGPFVRFVQEAWKQCFRKVPPPSGEAILLVLKGKEPEEEEPCPLEW